MVTYLSSTAQMSLFTTAYFVNVDPESIPLFLKDFKSALQSLSGKSISNILKDSFKLMSNASEKGHVAHLKNLEC